MWIGLQKLHEVTRQDWKLEIELTDWDNAKYKAIYNHFRVNDASSKFVLSIGGFDSSSTLGDAMAPHHGKKFSTYDHDNDEWSTGACSNSYKGAGWWFYSCYRCMLNGGDYGKSTHSIKWNEPGNRVGTQTWKASTMKLIGY